MADRVEGDRVFCHQCGNIWERAEHGLECPECLSDFVEILEGNDEDEPHSHEPSPRATPFPFGLGEEGFTDDGMTRRTYRSGNGRLTFTTTTYRSPSRSPMGGEQDRGVPFPDPLMPLFQNFNSLLQGLNRPPGQGSPQGPDFPGYPLDRQRHASDPGEDGGMRPGWTATGRLRPRDANRPQGDAHPFEYVDDILHMFEHEMQRGRQGGGFGGHAEGAPHIHLTDIGPLGIIAHMLTGGRHGDAVYSQEELDRVISELIDHNMNAGNAPGPASEDAIQKLPKKKIDASMMGSDGKAECSICMDGVELGTEVTVLPCTHWFHEACIAAWLREHDTCPHCRRGIQPQEEQRSQSQPPNPSSPSHARNSPVGTRTNPFILSDSPPRTRRPPPEFGDLGSEPQRRRTSSSGQGSSTSFSDWVRQRFGGGSSGNGGGG